MPYAASLTRTRAPHPSPSPKPGKGEYFPGLMPLVRAYLEAIGCDPETGEKVGEYMELLTTDYLLLTTYYLREGG